MFPVLGKLGPFTLHSFGLMMALGFLCGTWVSAKEYDRRGGDSEALWNMLTYVFFAGLLSSKILSVFNDVDALIENPLIAFSGSGFVWYGGFIGGAATAVLLGRRKKMPLLDVIDCSALGLALGQGIGRLGCHIAGDGDWGKVTDLPWGVAYTKAIVGWPHEPGVLVHPTPLYEAAAYISLFFVLRALARRDPAGGTVFAVYLIGNATARFLVEFLRINPRIAMGLTQAQLIAIVLFVVGCAWLLRLRAQGARAEVRSG